MFANIKGIGPKKAEALKRLGINKEEELLLLFPRRYEDLRKVSLLLEVENNSKVLLCLQIIKKHRTYYHKGMAISRIQAKDPEGTACQLAYFNDRFSHRKLELDQSYYFYGTLKIRDGKFSMANPTFIEKDEKKLVIKAIYPLTAGLSQKQISSFIGQALDKIEIIDPLAGKDLDILDLDTSLKYIHRPDNFQQIIQGHRSISFRKVFFNVLSIEYLKANKEFPGKIDLKLDRLENFIGLLDFDLTQGQINAIRDIVHDLEKEEPMNRLVQGDVGSGKTVVAIAAASVLAEGYQSAFIAPTEILARQQYESFKDLLKELGLRSGLLTGSSSDKEKKETKKSLRENKIQIVFGTHALLEEDIEFARLALTIIDEQHKFGVEQRNQLLEKSSYHNLLMLSATPIPRSLAIAKHGKIQISNIRTKPRGRKEIKTFAVNMDYEARIFSFIQDQVTLGKQAYVVCPSILYDEDQELESVDKVSKRLKAFDDSLKFASLHGKMTDVKKNQIIDAFARREIDVLVATTVIEVGIDSKNANLMVIYNAERFGLSQLHQLRGRVGRNSDQAYCILICTSNSKEARQRMKIMSRTSEGFDISDQDLKMRGPGELLGRNQHGQASDDLMVADADVLAEGYQAAVSLLEDDSYLRKEENKLIAEVVKSIISHTSGYLLN